jgi:hypothetical protein
LDIAGDMKVTVDQKNKWKMKSEKWKMGYRSDFDTQRWTSNCGSPFFIFHFSFFISKKCNFFSKLHYIGK